MRDTINMAREAGGRAQADQNCDDEYLMSADALKAFEALVRADEREACAAICDSVNSYDNPMTANDVADAIRARRKGGDYDRYESNIGHMFGDKR